MSLLCKLIGHKFREKYYRFSDDHMFRYTHYRFFDPCPRCGQPFINKKVNHE